MPGQAGDVELEEMIMESSYLLNKSGWVLKVLIPINVSLGILLLFVLFTDYSFDIRWANEFFPDIVGLIAICTWLLFLYKLPHSEKKRFSFFLLPSLVIGIPFLVGSLIFDVPYYLRFPELVRYHIEHSKSIQVIDAPDKTKSIEIYFSPTLCSDSTCYNVYLRNRSLPFFKRDLLLGIPLPEEPRNSIRWLDNKTILLPFDIPSQTNSTVATRTIDVGLVKVGWFNIRIFVIYLGLLMLIYGGIRFFRERINAMA